MPVRRFFSICVGMVGIFPKQFWDLSPVEVYMTIDGFIEFNGGSQEEKPMLHDELENLMELHPD